MITVIFDGIPYQVKPGRNLLEAALDLGLNLPYFCWHPTMRSVGACRQCAVRVYRDAEDKVGRIQMGCMTDARDGIRADIEDPGVIAFRRSVIEWLMINHPHDCPVCDEGGHCHLQDMTAMTGHVYRRYRGRKRTYDNQDLGPFVNHEMNRCIQCYRCVRFYRDLAGGDDLNAFASRNRVYFGREESGVLQSEFSGNLVEVCPTGVFTDKTLASHYTRKWDLETAPSVCPHCCLGCNTIPGARYNELRVIQNRYNGDVNGYFLCDRGRFGYEFANASTRMREAFSREKGKLPIPEAMTDAIERLRSAKRIVGIGSGRASLESNYALRDLVGEASFSPGLPDSIHVALNQAIEVFQKSPIYTPSLREVENADAVLILAADPTNEAPMLDFSIRQGISNSPRLRVADRLKIPHWDDGAIRVASQGVQGSLTVATTALIKLEGIAQRIMHADPGELLDLAEKIRDSILGTPAGNDAADGTADALLNAEQPLVVVSATAEAATIRAAANIVWALRSKGKNGWLTVITPQANDMGVVLMGGRTVTEILAEIESGKADALVVLENDLNELVATPRIGEILGKLSHLIVLDCIQTQTGAAADIALPAASYAESSGTFVNNEGRAQRFFQVFVPKFEVRESWAMLCEIRKALRPSSGMWGIYEEVTRDLSRRIPALAGAINASPSHNWRIAGMKIARDPHRYSGRTAMEADRSVVEPRPPADPGTPFAFTMEGYQGQPPSPLIPRFWAPGWNSNNSVVRFQEEVNGPLRGGNPGVRLIEPGKMTPRPYEAPSAAAPAPGEFWMVPVWRIFGSEILSRQAARIQEVIAGPSAGLNPEDASALGVSGRDAVEFTAGGQTRTLPARLDPQIPRGVITIPAGYPETRGINAPAHVSIRRAK